MATDNKELRSLVLGVDVGELTDLVQLDQNGGGTFAKIANAS